MLPDIAEDAGETLELAAHRMPSPSPTDGMMTSDDDGQNDYALPNHHPECTDRRMGTGSAISAADAAAATAATLGVKRGPSTNASGC